VTTPRLEGRVSVHPRGFGFVTFPPGSDPESAFVAPPDLNGFLTDDLVTGRLEASPKGHRILELKLADREREQLFGKVIVRQGKRWLNIDPEISNTDWPLDGADKLDEGTFVVASIRAKRAKVEREVAATEQSLERVMVRHDLPTAFPDLPPPKKLPRKELERRRDLREMVTVTIDAPSTKDIDDAVAALPADEHGALRVLVSIADVDAMVPIDSPLDLEARRRATSVYLADRVIPMFPRELSEDALSLHPGVDRPTVTVEMRVDPEGQVTATDVYESVIRSHARLDYKSVAAFLEGDDEAVEEPVRPTLRWLRTAVARLDIVRSARGGVSFIDDESVIKIDEDTREPTEVIARKNTVAHQLIERLMVAANEAVATWLRDRGLPTLYRVHDEPEPERVAQLSEAARLLGLEAGFGKTLTPRALAAFEHQFRDRPNAPALQTVLRRLLGPARYDKTPTQHFGLGAPLYLHFTSPIRRYADLVVHRVCKAYLAGRRESLPHAEDLDTIALNLNDRSYRADKAERERMRMLAARLFKQRIGERMRGNVVALKPFGLIVQLEKSGITATVAAEELPGGPYKTSSDGFAYEGKSRRFVIGQPLRIEVVDADEVLGRIELKLA
jgi:ribonuclease R